MKTAILLLALLVNCAHPTPSNQGVPNYGIYGGQNATLGQFPYQASIWGCVSAPVPIPNPCIEYCSAAIISPSWIVSSAQCHNPYRTPRIGHGYINSSNLQIFIDTSHIAQTFIHENYTKGQESSNDIMLYKLDKPLVFNDLIQPIKLPKQNSNYTGEAVTSGWGPTLTNKTAHSPILQYQITNIPDGETCLNLAKAIGSKNFSVTAHVCTENPEKDHGLCDVDAGGPLVQNGTLVGIASWKPSACGQKNAPSVFTRVSNYVDWISNIVTDPLNFD